MSNNLSLSKRILITAGAVLGSYASFGLNSYHTPRGYVPLAGVSDPSLQKYQGLKKTIDRIEKEERIPNDLLELIVLVETDGKSKDRFEPGFKKRYIDSKPLNGLCNNIYQKLKERNPNLTIEEFKRQLATSVGPAQVVYATAIDLGFTGTIDELREDETNLRWAARLIKKDAKETKYDWKKVLTKYNTGSVKGKPTKGHLERGKKYKQFLQKRK